MAFDMTTVILSEDRLQDWFAVLPPRDAAAVDRLRSELRERVDRTRMVFLVANEPVAVAIIERDGVGATTWMPRSREPSTAYARETLVEIVAKRIVEFCKTLDVNYLECTLQRNGEAEQIWRRAMLAAGFTALARKCHYEHALSATSRVPCRLPGATRIEIADPSHPRVERVYARSVAASRDRTTVFEFRHGASLGEADRVLVASCDGADLGLCALEHRAGAERGWIKYVGTVPEARRRGIARALVCAGLDALMERGASVAECLIDVDNAASVALHENLGFQSTHTFGDDYYVSLAQPDRANS